jgi:hypothetical protein
MYAQIVTFYFQDDAGAASYFARAEEVDEISGQFAVIQGTRANGARPARDLNQAVSDAGKRYPGLALAMFPCLWVESAGKHVVVPLPDDEAGVARTFRRLCDVLREARSFADVESAHLGRPARDTRNPAGIAKTVAKVLDKVQFKALVRAIDDAFDQEELRSLLRVECGRRLDHLVALPMTWGPLVTQVVQRAEQDDFTPELVMAVAAWKPRNVALAVVLRELTLAPGVGATLAVSPALAAGYADAPSALQGRVRARSGYADIDQFQADLAMARPRICRIESAHDPSDAVGTGFLVADDLVLTNFHVKALLDARGAQPACRFDYVRLAGNPAARDGLRVPAAAGNPWVAASPYAPGDVRRDGTAPTADHLDYALLHLPDPVGLFPPGHDQPGDPSDARGHFPLRADAVPLAAGEDVVVLQHPGGQPLKVALGSALASGVPFRSAHDAPTERGTSGSPVFDLQLQLRALHHATDPADPDRPQFNQAVPIGLVAADLAARGAL